MAGGGRGRGKVGTVPCPLAARLCGARGGAETACGRGGGLLLLRLLGGRGGAEAGPHDSTPCEPRAQALPPGCRAQASLKASMALRVAGRALHVLKCE